MNLPSILTPDLGLLFWMALAFLVVLVFLAKYALPAIVGSVEGRKQFIDDSLRKAHEATERLENVRQECEVMNSLDQPICKPRATVYTIKGRNCPANPT